MKKFTPIRISIFVAVLAVIMIVLSLPGDVAMASDYEQNPNVRFTVINYSQHPFTMNAYGPEAFTFEVEPHSKRSWVVPRGTYSFVMEACNHTSSGVLNLNIYQVMHVSVCGGRTLKNDKHHEIDVTEYIKMVKIGIENKTWEPIRLYLRTLDNHYYLNLEPREETSLIVPRDRYVYSFVACDDLESGYYNARSHIPLELRCSNK
jgi:hypothetical protein